MALKFTPSEIPAQAFTRTKEPNPYIDFAKALNAKRDSSQKTTGTVDEITKAVRLMRLAGAEVGCTVRVKVEDGPDVKRVKNPETDKVEATGTQTLTAWAVDQITRPRKPVENAATE